MSVIVLIHCTLHQFDALNNSQSMEYFLSFSTVCHQTWNTTNFSMQDTSYLLAVHTSLACPPLKKEIDSEANFIYHLNL